MGVEKMYYTKCFFYFILTHVSPFSEFFCHVLALGGFADNSNK